MADVARGERLRALRQERRLTQPDAADAAGVTLRAYQAWEASGGDDGREAGIKWEHAKKLAAFYEVDPESLVRRPDEAAMAAASAEDVVALRAQLDRMEQNQAELDEKLTNALEFLAYLNDVARRAEDSSSTEAAA